jgi:hypothetical protein
MKTRETEKMRVRGRQRIPLGGILFVSSARSPNMVWGSEETRYGKGWGWYLRFSGTTRTGKFSI